MRSVSVVWDGFGTVLFATSAHNAVSAHAELSLQIHLPPRLAAC